MEIADMTNEEGIKSAIFTICKKSFCISFWEYSKTIRVCALNASAKTWGMRSGKNFRTKDQALNGYKSQEAKAAIEKAALLFQFK